MKYDQSAMVNLNCLLKSLKQNPNAATFAPHKLVMLLESALTTFNEIPKFSYFTFNDTDFITHYHECLVECAAIMLNEYVAKIEKQKGGKAKTIKIPNMSQLAANDHFCTWFEVVRNLKQNLVQN